MFLRDSNDGLARDEGKMSDYRSIVIGCYGRDYRFAAIFTRLHFANIGDHLESLARAEDGPNNHDGLGIYLEICFYRGYYYDICVKRLLR